jgi:3-carboxy-cis,cis-muconate cycloisomerase
MPGNIFARSILGRHDDPFSDAALLRAMLRFETALAQAQGALGLIPQSAADAITRHAPGFAPDAAALAKAAAESGTLAVPFVRALTEHLHSVDAAAAAHVHAGSTSQDVLDTALVLCTRDAVQWIAQALADAARSAERLARAHASTATLARTLRQPAGVTALGLRFAQWSHAVAAGRARLLATAHTALAVSLGGAAGNLSARGARGSALRAEVARLLGLHDPQVTWHTGRGNWLALACDAALVAGTLGKIADDVAHAATAEIGELHEPQAPGRGSSSALPHKRNPVLSMRVLAAVQPVPGLLAGLLAGMRQEQERGLGGWQAELMQAPQLFTYVLAGADAVARLLDGLHVDTVRCRANIDALHGLVFSEALATLLIPALGRAEAHTLIASLCERAVREGVHLRELIPAADPRLRPLEQKDVDAAFDADRAVHAAADQIEPTLALTQRLLQ